MRGENTHGAIDCHISPETKTEIKNGNKTETVQAVLKMARCCVGLSSCPPLGFPMILSTRSCGDRIQLEIWRACHLIGFCGTGGGVGGEVLDFPTQLGRKSKGDKKGTSKGCVEFYRSNDFCSVLHPLGYFALNIYDLFYISCTTFIDLDTCVVAR